MRAREKGNSVVVCGWQVATEVTFDVLLAAAEAAAWAVVAAYPEHALADPHVGIEPPRDPIPVPEPQQESRGPTLQ